MRLDIHGLFRLRPRRPVAAVTAVVGAGTLGVGAMAAVLVATGSATPSAVRPTVSASPRPTATPPPQSTWGDFADFQAAQQQAAAAAPIKHLPHVRLATVSVDGIPPVPLAAYHHAAELRAAAQPGCQLPWWLLAGIGFIESGHAHSGGSQHVGWNGVARPAIFGPELDGKHGYKAIPDTDGGHLDGDPRWDRAVGPMQFLPSTWLKWGPTGHFDGHANPQNIWAAANAAAAYLCARGTDISQPHAMALAVYSYNHSFDYVRLVLSVGARYAGMSPDQLGVNLLPKDHPKKANHKKNRRGANGNDATARGSRRPTASPTPSASPSASPSPSPSPSPSRSLVPNPLPTLTPPLFPH